MESTFIERFGLVGMAGVLVLMAALGLYGAASLIGVEPNRPFTQARSDEVSARLEPERLVRSLGPAADRVAVTPAALSAETPLPSPTPGTASSPTETPLRQVSSLVTNDARAAASVPTPAAPATAVATPPPSSEPSTSPTPAPEQPTSTPPAACLPGGLPQITDKGDEVRFEYGTRMLYESNVLLVDVGGTLLALIVTDATEVRGDLTIATVISGRAHRSTDGSLLAQRIEVICP